MEKENAIRDSWHTNADAWIRIIDEAGIESRKLVTNAAIVDAVLQHHPKKVLDLGCGEGWLCRKLNEKGIEATGVDFIPALIDRAMEQGNGVYYLASYEELARKEVPIPTDFDLVVINFALIGKESSALALGALPQYLNPLGRLVIQTLHPAHRQSLGDDTTGWKTGSWDGLGSGFVQPYEWYYRTLSDWTQLITLSGFTDVHTTTTIHPKTGAPCSLIIEAVKA